MNTESPSPVPNESVAPQASDIPNAVAVFPEHPEEGAVYFTPPMIGLDSLQWKALPSDEREAQLNRRLELKRATGNVAAGELKRLRHEARTDALTQLPNYSSLQEDVRAAVEKENAGGGDPEKSRLFILNIDIDKFKQVNDTMGHDSGDAVLQRFADLGKEIVLEAIANLELRAGAKLYRKSGDEFYVVGHADITGNSQRHTSTPEEQVIALSGRIRNAVDEKLAEIKSIIPGFGASIGHVLHEEGEDAATFLRRSDVEMYKQKNSKKSDDTPSR